MNYLSRPRYAKFFFFFYGVKNTPTIRSFYTLEQYREVLQKFAYKQAVEVLAKLSEAPKPKKVKHSYSTYGDKSDYYYTVDSQDLKIKASGPELDEVVAYPFSFSFRKRTISVSYNPKDQSIIDGCWYFQVEEKIYTDSNHSSKLHYDGNSPESKKKQIELINAFVAKLMEGIVPEQRFDLKKFSKSRAKLKAVAS